MANLTPEKCQNCVCRVCLSQTDKADDATDTDEYRCPCQNNPVACAGPFDVCRRHVSSLHSE